METEVDIDNDSMLWHRSRQKVPLELDSAGESWAVAKIKEKNKNRGISS